MLDILLWWLAIEAAGAVALPVALVAFQHLPERGYAFAKPLGLLLAGYVFWLLGFAHGIPTNRGGWLIALTSVAAVSAYLIGRRGIELKRWLSANRRELLIAEVVFAVAFVVWAVIRAFNPEIAGTEKPMDFAFINGVGRSTSFPPVDPWLAGASISYYYFGHLIVSGMIQLTGVDPAVGFNLAVASIFGLAASGAVSLVGSLARVAGARPRAALATGLLAAVLLLGVSNLQGALELVRVHGVGSAELWQTIGVNGALEPRQSRTWYPDEPGWWWWRATRVINTLTYQKDANGRIVAVDDRADYTITEFPFFSFMLGDLHPHVMALPFGLLALALALNALLSKTPLTRWNLHRRWAELLLAGLVLGALGFMNSWDFPTYALIYLGAVAAGFVLHGAAGAGRDALEQATEGTVARGLVPRLAVVDSGWRGTKPHATPLLERLVDVTARYSGTDAPAQAGLATIRRAIWPIALLMVGGGILLYLPFYATFRTQASGILPVLGPGTRGIHYVLIWGLFIPPVLLLIAAAFRPGLVRRRWPWLVVPIAPAALWSVAALVLGNGGQFVLERWVGIAPLLLGTFLALASLADTAAGVSRGGESITSSDASASIVPTSSDGQVGPPGTVVVFTLGLVAVAIALTLGCELFFVLDVFGNRMNTVFKLYYQAWVLLAVAGSVAIYWAVASAGSLPALRRFPVVALVGVFAVLMVASLGYPLAATYTKAGLFQGSPTLDGLAFVDRAVAGEYEAVRWLNHNVRGPAVVVEAAGGQYSDFGRISARTGMPTLLGWAGHERQWRGTDAAFRGRDGDVDQIYRSSDRNAVAGLLGKYSVDYVVVGSLERAKYGALVAQKFEALMDVAYRNSDVSIFRVRH